MIGNDNLEQNFKTYYIKLRGAKQGETPHFEFTHKVGDSYEVMVTERDITQFTGVLQSVEKNVREWEGDEIVSYKLTLVDGEAEERYVLEINQNAFWREMVNRLANLVKLDGGLHFVKFGVYSGEFEGDDGEMRESRGFYVHSDLNKGKHEVQFSTLRDKIKTVTVGKKEIKDMSEMNEYFEKMLNEQVIPAISESPLAPIADAA